MATDSSRVEVWRVTEKTERRGGTEVGNLVPVAVFISSRFMLVTVAVLNSLASSSFTDPACSL